MDGWMEDGESRRRVTDDEILTTRSRRVVTQTCAS